MALSRFSRVQMTAAALLLAAGSSYAGLKVARNSVGSPQVKNNSLASVDIKDRTIKPVDVARGVLPEVYSFEGPVPVDNLEHQIMVLPGGVSLTVICNSTTNQRLFASFPAGSEVKVLRVTGHDLFDNNPVGTASIRGLGGGVGINGIATAFEGQLWLHASDVVAHGDWAMAPPSGGTCRVMVQVIVKRLATPVPVPRPAAKASTCEAVGSGLCRRTSD